MNVNELAEMIKHAVPWHAEEWARKLLEAISRALREPPQEPPQHAWRACDVHDIVYRHDIAYACTIRVRASHYYSRHAILAPGAVIVIVRDGAETRCYVYTIRAIEETLKIMDVENASELHVWPEGEKAEVWRYICLR